MTLINAYLTFDGNCREAMNFYQQCLGGELSFQSVESSPMAAQIPAHLQKNVLHASLIKDSLVLMASDMIGKGGFVKGNTISLTLNCSSAEEITKFFHNLSQEGKINDPLQEQFWGATFGALTDKYGINWLLNYDKNQSN